MKSLLYVSNRRIGVDARSSDIDDIVSVSRVRNASLELTGALVATPDHFAQILEGPITSLDTVMASIARDPRHFALRVAPAQEIARREFHRWTLAYHGESSYVAGLVASAIAARDFDLVVAAQDIRSLIAMLA